MKLSLRLLSLLLLVQVLGPTALFMVAAMATDTNRGRLRINLEKIVTEAGKESHIVIRTSEIEKRSLCDFHCSDHLQKYYSMSMDLNPTHAPSVLVNSIPMNVPSSSPVSTTKTPAPTQYVSSLLDPTLFSVSMSPTMSYQSNKTVATADRSMPFVTAPPNVPSVSSAVSSRPTTPPLATTRNPISTTFSPTGAISNPAAETTAVTTTQPYAIFQCSDSVVALVPGPYPGDLTITVVDLQITYSVDSLAVLESYRSELEQQIVAVALAGALQCGMGGPLFDPLADGYDAAVTKAAIADIPITTSNTGETCFPELDASSVCTILETKLQVNVKGSFDANIAAILAYIMLHDEISDSAFIDDIQEVEYIKYLEPSLGLSSLVSENDFESRLDSVITMLCDTITALLKQFFGIDRDVC